MKWMIDQFGRVHEVVDEKLFWETNPKLFCRPLSKYESAWYVLHGTLEGFDWVTA